MNLPKVISGTSLLGNLYREPAFDQKLAVVKEYIDAVPGLPVFDSAGKYGAGLALEILGQCLQQLGIKKNEVIISNKLAWTRTPLLTAEPLFERGVWKNLKYDAAQKISYDGILECFDQGNCLLNGYAARLVSVHDPDEYLAAATSNSDYEKRYQNILEAYRALAQLKKNGVVQGIGIGAKDWRTMALIEKDVTLDWVMIANSLTIFQHPPALLGFVRYLSGKGIAVINSAVFHGGFLMGGNFFNYIALDAEHADQKFYFQWRQRFFDICAQFLLDPAAAAIYFALHIPGVKSLALNSSNPQRVRKNIEWAEAELPPLFWKKLKQEKLIDPDYPYV